MRLRDIGSSKLAFLFIAFFVYSIVLFNQRWKTDTVISNDLTHYYVYLPAAFIYHDLSLSYNNDKLPAEVRNKTAICSTKDDKHHYSKMACGWAIMMLPFFLAAHILVQLFGEHANGYSYMYSMFICIANLVYLILGLYYLRRTLLRFFNENTTALVLVIIALGTNLYTYTTYTLDSSHTFSFCAMSIFIWQAIRWNEAPTIKRSIILGLLLGLITLIRPTNIAILIFLMLYGIVNKETFRTKIKMLWKERLKVLVILICLFIGILPQLILWKIELGTFIYYSYGAEKFYFLHPMILKGLFSFRNGLFIYTPVMMLTIPGLYFAWRTRKQFFIASLVFIAVNFYIIFSWWCWWYGGSFSIRPMIDSYALMALPLAAFMEGFGRINRKTKYFIISLSIIFILLNQFQTLQVQTGVMHYSDMTFKTYKKIFGRLAFPEGYTESLVHPDFDRAVTGEIERDFSDDYPFLKGGKKNFVTIKAYNGKYVYADIHRDGLLVADGDSVKRWETFGILMEDYARVNINSFENKFVSIDPGANGIMNANRDKAASWERFWVMLLPDKKYSIKSNHNQKYVKPNPLNNNILEASSDSVTAKEEFEIIGQ